MADDADFRRGVALFNAGDYFAAHEVWEIPWRDGPAADHRFYQSLIQAAVALYHHGRGNRDGAMRLAARGRAKAVGYADRHNGVDLAEFWAATDAALAGGPAPILVPAPSRPDGTDHV